MIRFLSCVCVLTFAACASDDDPTAHLTGTEEDALTSINGSPVCLSPKVLVCHIPPGNPANAHYICVGAPAVKTHEKHHGDNLAACEPAAVPDAGEPLPPPPEDAGTPAACGEMQAACVTGDDCCAGLACVQNLCVPDIQ